MISELPKICCMYSPNCRWMTSTISTRLDSKIAQLSDWGLFLSHCSDVGARDWKGPTNSEVRRSGLCGSLYIDFADHRDPSSTSSEPRKELDMKKRSARSRRSTWRAAVIFSRCTYSIYEEARMVKIIVKVTAERTWLSGWFMTAIVVRATSSSCE